MRGIRLFFLELRRLLKSRITWLVIFLTVLSPAAGLFLYKPASSTMLSIYLANPSIAGGLTGGVLFGLLTVYELDRAGRSCTEVLLNAAVSPLRMAMVHLAALIGTAALTLAAVMTVWLPVSRAMIGSVFDAGDYVLAYLIFMGLALPLGILAAAAAFQFTCRSDLSLVLFAVFVGLSLTVWAENWQLCWLNPSVWALSDDFSNLRIYRSAAYMRFTWLAGLGGVWTLSWICIRQYGKGLWGSFVRNARRIYRPVTALLLAGCSVMAFVGQPMVDRSNPDETVFSLDEIPYLEEVVCSGRSARVFPDTSAGTVAGQAAYQFQNTSGKKQKVDFAVTPGYRISSVQVNGKDAVYELGDYQEYNEAMLEVEIPEEKAAEVTVEYGGFPRENRNMSSMQGSREISREYLCLENAALAPRLLNVQPDEGMYPAVIEITLPDSMTVIPFGTAEAEIVKKQDNGTSTWRYQDHGTGGIVYAGDYIRQDIEAGGIDIELYYGRSHQKIMETAGAAEAVKTVVDYCTEHYGTLAFGSGGSLKLIQSRVSGGGYAAAGASLLDETDFTAANLTDSRKGAGYGEVMIHELVHQWWGLGCMFDNSDGTDPWSAEGLTVYTTFRIAEKLYGEEYAEKNYLEQWRQAAEEYYLNFYVRNPEYLAALPEDRQLEISNSLAYVRQYCEMPLKIRKAEELVGGEEAMDQILRSLFSRELDPAYPYLTYQDFLDACGLKEEDLNLDQNI